MNDAAKLVSEALLGEDFKTIFICNKAYVVQAPSIKIMCRGLKEWSCLSVQGDKQTKLSATLQVPENIESILKGVSIFIVGNRPDYEKESNKLLDEWDKDEIGVSQDELNLAIDSILHLIDVNSFFQYAQKCLSATKIIARPK